MADEDRFEATERRIEDLEGEVKELTKLVSALIPKATRLEESSKVMKADLGRVTDMFNVLYQAVHVGLGTTPANNLIHDLRQLIADFNKKYPAPPR